MPTLSPHQEAAVKTVVARFKGLIEPEPVTTLCGYAGTGKSTILPDIIEACDINPETVAFVAPTGKAAKVMRRKLLDQGIRAPMIGTIHSAIYRGKPAPVSKLEADLAEHEQALLEAEMLARSQGDYSSHEVEKQKKLVARLRRELEQVYEEDKINFQLNPDAPIQMARLIVCDEASMVNEEMATDLQSFGVPILAIGDPGQLPPVEGKGGFLVGRPDAMLTEIHRQAADNPIIRLATLAREGEDLPIGTYGAEARVMRRKDYDPVFDLTTRPTLLCGMNKTRWRINLMLRHEFGFVDDAREMVGPRAGEPLMVRKNNKENPDLVNGTECVATSDGVMQKGDTTFTMSFEDEEGLRYPDKRIFQGLFEENYTKTKNKFYSDARRAWRARKSSIEMDLAYAFTVHNAQGSQWDEVVLIDESSVFRQDANKHLYTGITRAAKDLTILV